MDTDDKKDRTILKLPNGRQFIGSTMRLHVGPAGEEILPGWTDEMADIVFPEGWQLTAVFEDPELLEIQRLDYPEGATLRWSSDERALQHVKARAQGGQTIHQLALKHHERCKAAVRDALIGYHTFVAERATSAS